MTFYHHLEKSPVAQEVVISTATLFCHQSLQIPLSRGLPDHSVRALLCYRFPDASTRNRLKHLGNFPKCLWGSTKSSWNYLDGSSCFALSGVIYMPEGCFQIQLWPRHLDPSAVGKTSTTAYFSAHKTSPSSLSLFISWVNINQS